MAQHRAFVKPLDQISSPFPQLLVLTTLRIGRSHSHPAVVVPTAGLYAASRRPRGKLPCGPVRRTWFHLPSHDSVLIQAPQDAEISAGPDQDEPPTSGPSVLRHPKSWLSLPCHRRRKFIAWGLIASNCVSMIYFSIKKDSLIFLPSIPYISASQEAACPTASNHRWRKKSRTQKHRTRS